MNNLKTFEEFDWKFGMGKKEEDNIPEKYRDVYKKIKKAFTGVVTVEFLPQYREWPKSKPEAIIKVKGEDKWVGSKPFFCKRENMPVKKFDGTVLLMFYLDRNLQDIINWLNERPGEVKRKSELDDFLDNFDAYQGEGTIEPTKETPYEFIDLD